GNERTVAQLWGHTWPGGHVLLGFQFNDSAALACNTRAYCAANGDFRRFGGGDLRGVGGNPGTILDPGTLAPLAAIPHGQDGTQLNLSGSYSKSTTEFVEANNLNDPAALVPGLNSSDATTALNLFGDGSHSSAAALANLRSQIATFDGLNLFTTASASVIADG